MALSTKGNFDFFRLVLTLLQIVVALALWNFKTSLDSIKEILNLHVAHLEKRIDKLENKNTKSIGEQ